MVFDRSINSVRQKEAVWQPIMNTMQLQQNSFLMMTSNKRLDWCAAGFHSQLIFDYLAEALPEKKKPREPFPFAEKNMSRLLVRLSQDMMWLDQTILFGTLNGLYWFMGFLEDTLSLSSEQAKLNRESCVRIFEQAYPAQQEQGFKAEFFSTGWDIWHQN